MRVVVPTLVGSAYRAGAAAVPVGVQPSSPYLHGRATWAKPAQMDRAVIQGNETNHRARTRPRLWPTFLKAPKPSSLSLSPAFASTTRLGCARRTKTKMELGELAQISSEPSASPHGTGRTTRLRPSRPKEEYGHSTTPWTRSLTATATCTKV
ncbi:hypothetical protein L3X38_036153 [Prunus dulcis]|uniref:Uncharacterized protein n=1 Tax=Prunus dulcis TaxID=3755 RepID=A0AAD4YP75_PRUDU|nr:hypothetical protein L3X38_036153 [Prunus dulcis]